MTELNSDTLSETLSNIVDVTTTNAKNIMSSTSNLYRKLRRLSSVGKYNRCTLQVCVEKERYTSQETGELESKLQNYINKNNLNVDISIDQIK